MRYLVTEWFGSFLLDDDGKVLDQSIFPKDPEQIAQRLLRVLMSGVKASGGANLGL